MSSLVNMEFLTNPSEFGDFSLHSSLNSNNQDILLVTGSDNVTMHYDYTLKLDEDSGEADKTTYLEFTDLGIIIQEGKIPVNLEEIPHFISENNLVINKIEFDHENGRSVSVKVEFQADTEEDAENIKNKAKAYGIAVK